MSSGSGSEGAFWALKALESGFAFRLTSGLGPSLVLASWLHFCRFDFAEELVGRWVRVCFVFLGSRCLEAPLGFGGG